MKKLEPLMYILPLSLLLLALSSCSLSKSIDRQAHSTLIDSKSLASAHVGISIFDSASNKPLYNYQSDKYFVPCSNVKLFTLYAGLKYLPDSLIGARIGAEEGTIMVQASGDPTFLHPDFPYQPLLAFLQRDEIQVIRLNTDFASTSFGAGWSWDDYLSRDMAERDPFPMYGNMATIIFEGDSIRTIPPSIRPFVIGVPEEGKRWQIRRSLGGHTFEIDTTGGNTDHIKRVTMAMDKGLFATRYLSDTLHKNIISEYTPLDLSRSLPLYSQPKDTVFRYMMHHSDNFFAEQTLLMASQELFGEMNDARMLDTIMNADLKDVPQRPRWVDGSGLSRYNQFTPEDFVWMLNKMRTVYGINRLKALLSTANEGTLKNLYHGYAGNIYAKSGSMSNNIALSGYLMTKHGRQLTFSVMVNDEQAPLGEVRKQIEQFVTRLIETY